MNPQVFKILRRNESLIYQGFHDYLAGRILWEKRHKPPNYMNANRYFEKFV